jgi:putative hemolysin
MTYRPHYMGSLRRANDGAPNVTQSLKGAAERTGDPVLVKLAADAQALQRRIREAAEVAEQRFQVACTHPDFDLMRAGLTSYPDDIEVADWR